MAKEIFTYCSKTSCLYNSLLDFATSLEKKNPEEPSWVDSRVLSARFTNPLSNVTLRKTNKNDKFTKREKFSKSEVGPKKKLARSGCFLLVIFICICICILRIKAYACTSINKINYYYVLSYSNYYTKSNKQLL